jgi:hypothetical protein
VPKRSKRTRKERSRTRSGKGGKVLLINMEKQGLKVDRSDGAPSPRRQFHGYYKEHGHTAPKGVDPGWWSEAVGRHLDWVRNTPEEERDQ